MSINIQKFERLDLPSGLNEYKVKNEISEIDKYIKCMVIGDAFKTITRDIEYSEESEENEDDNSF